MTKIKRLYALEILDSRGRPTVQSTCVLESGASATASVPSGASTGQAEAHELRDGDLARYGGLGCLQAVENVNTTINEALSGKVFASQSDLDLALIDLDGTGQKSNLGANAILAVSIAFARACAANQDIPLYQHFGQMIGRKALEWLPRPTINLFSGGKHAGEQVGLQDVLVIPSVPTMHESLSVGYAVYQAAAKLIAKKYNMRALTADEGGLAPDFPDILTMFKDSIQAIEQAEYVPGKDVFLAVDVAASHFYSDGVYHIDGCNLTSSEMIEAIAGWVESYPIVSVEDGLAEEDWGNWPDLCSRIQDQALVLGDDFLCTHPQRILHAIDSSAANALLLKVNQIGTLSEAAEALAHARDDGWQVILSARSGETEDNWLADLAVGWQGDQIKIGSITQSERLAKYNRLLNIEAGTNLPVRQWPE